MVLIDPRKTRTCTSLACGQRSTAESICSCSKNWPSERLTTVHYCHWNVIVFSKLLGTVASIVEQVPHGADRPPKNTHVYKSGMRSAINSGVNMFLQQELAV